MTLWHRALWLLLMLMLPLHLLAAPQTVDFRETDDVLMLGRDVRLHEDVGGASSLGAIVEGPHAWRGHDADVVNVGYSRSVWWMHVRLHNAQPLETSRVFDVGSPLQDEVDIYVIRHDGSPMAHVQTGDRRPFSARPIDTPVPSMPIAFKAGESLDVYVRLASHDGLHESIQPRLWSSNGHARALQMRCLTDGLYFGTLAAVLVYNLLLFMSTRQRSLGLYAIHVLSMLVWAFTFRGYAFQYLWPEWPTFNNQFLPIAVAAAFCSFGLFIVDYVRSDLDSVWMRRTVIWAAAGTSLSVLPALLGRYAPAFLLIGLAAAVMMTMCLASGLLLIRRGSRPARYAVVSFGLLACGVFVYAARVLGWLPSNAFTEHFVLVGSAAQVLLLAFGLADQLNQLKESKLLAEQQAHAAKTALADELESLANRRTRALMAVNKRLGEASIKDDLTGAFNQRHFVDRLEEARALHARCGVPLALCLFEIDRFDALNERHGHPAGDLVLQRAAKVLQMRLQRRGDLLFRIDKSTFGLILRTGPDIDVTAFVRQLQADLQALHMAHAFDEPVAFTRCVPTTASVGLLLVLDTARRVTAPELHDAVQAQLVLARAAGPNGLSVDIWRPRQAMPTYTQAVR
ncbi:MAG: diguanylate cyclase [Aquabacterium sp.]